MKESYFKRIVLAELAVAGLDPHTVRAEAGGVSPGTPDVEHVYGWLELKAVDRWPVRDVPLRIEHFTRQQRVWLQRRWHCGGRAYLLVRVGRDIVMLDGCKAARFIGEYGRTALVFESLAHDLEGAIECVTQPFPSKKFCSCGAALPDSPRPEPQKSEA